MQRVWLLKASGDSQVACLEQIESFRNLLLLKTQSATFRRGRPLNGARLTGIAGIISPDTIRRWYRTLVAKKYDGAPTPWCPSTKADIAALVVRIAKENPTWG